ncbi:proline-rich family protein [Melia azedarach]|uniref:Proline-rich family protein n=1 Tax=Melia azedarach TaxID=155640 RepID=A0ACC1XJW1_MELAZ|nr:proline-rich family protein [Melia azedarach]
MSTGNAFSTATTSPQPSPQQQQQQQHIYQNLRPPTTPNPNKSQGVLYPVASSGRGFIPKPMRPNNNNSADQTVTVANHGGYPPRPNQLPPYHPPRPHLDASLSNHHVAHHQHQIVRPSINQQQQHHHHPQVAPPVRGIPVSCGHLKVAPSPSSVSDTDGYKHLREKRDETIAVVRDRKVRVSDGASLYALCRTWLRNGSPEESQPRYGDGVKSLPRPLPMPVADANVVMEKEDEDDDDENDEDENVDDLSAEDLLRRHVHRAKKVRARLREERTKRIGRYKTRLGLLLPPIGEQSRNDGPAGN